MKHISASIREIYETDKEKKEQSAVARRRVKDRNAARCMRDAALKTCGQTKAREGEYTLIQDVIIITERSSNVPIGKSTILHRTIWGWSRVCILPVSAAHPHRLPTHEMETPWSVKLIQTADSNVSRSPWQCMASGKQVRRYFKFLPASRTKASMISTSNSVSLF